MGCAKRGAANGHSPWQAERQSRPPAKPRPVRVAANCGVCVVALLGFVVFAMTFVARLASLRILLATRFTKDLIRGSLAFDSSAMQEYVIINIVGMRIGPFIFRPGIGLTVIVLVLIALFVRLGIWQLDRAEQKEKLKAGFESRVSLPVLELHPDTDFLPDLRFRRILVKGHFERNNQILLDNQTYDGRAGVHVLTPLRIGDSETRVLIDRGWVALGPSREHLPEPEVPEGETEVHGVIDIPSPPRFILGDASQSGPARGGLWPYIDLDYFSKYAGYPVKPYLIRQDPGDPYGYVRVLPNVETKWAMHIGYAIQWFALAVVAFGVYLGMSISRADKRLSPEAK
jgi:surfeit locus 1 family protein